MNHKRKNTDLFKRLLTYTRPYRMDMLLALLCALFGVTCSLLSPVLIGHAVDYIIGPGNVDFPKIFKVLVRLALTIAGGALLQWLMTYFTNKITFQTVKDLRTQAFQKLGRVPLKYIDSNSHGDIINTVVNDIDTISDGLLQGFAQLFTGLVTILGTIGFMLSINVGIGLAVIFLTPLSLFVASFISKRIYNKFSEQSKIRGEMSGLIEEMVGNQKVVKTFSYENRAIERFGEINARLYDCGVLAQFYSSLTNPCTRFVNGIVYAVVGLLGAFSAIEGRITIGQLSSFLSYANQYTKPFNEISGVITELQSALASAKRVFAMIDEEVEPSDEDKLEDVRFDGSVIIEDVSFSYDKNRSLIENLNLKVKPGSKIAIVGPTGCGKTTIINLLMRFYDTDRGNILVSGVDIKDMKRKTLRGMYGMVLQDTWLFSGTIRDNIAYGKQNVTEEEIIAAAKAAHAHSFIKRLPQGYDYVITEEGGNISQGQKQLLSIARVMLTRPKMLILDEATSNIDTRTEIRVQKAFDKLMEGRTSFIVAHRLSTIKEADVILVMNNGKIIEQGNHEELLLEGGFYAQLYNSQFDVTG
ncbi:MAG: ABC transporter ATP-binding protein [Clostridiales bacterium]|jgi:ATP-binding cassette subfamily B multidrug efflux pump|nr:ABC transporter ATP-binding protein [Clostridiales bacterium]